MHLRATASPSRQDRIAEVLAGLLLAGALLAGGGSRGAGDLLVHLLAPPALVLGSWRWYARPRPLLQRAISWLWLAALAVIGLQLLPLPAALVVSLPGRAEVVSGLELAGAATAWLPMSLSPSGTLRAGLALLSVGSLWLLCASLDGRAQRRLLWLAIAIGSAQALLGFAQASAGARAVLALHPNQNIGVATGLFANRNHLACLLAMLVPLALGLGWQAQQRRQHSAALLPYAATAVMALGVALSFSRAGNALLALGLAASLALLLSAATQDQRRPFWRHPLLLLTLAGTALAVAAYAWERLAARFGRPMLEDGRLDYLQQGWPLIAQYLPWGSGAGSFREVYGAHEPLALLAPNYVLHAHNEPVELLLELGLPGGLLLLAGIALLAAITWKVWRTTRSEAALLPRLAVLGLWLPLLHSAVDYPLRTLAIGALVALLLAVTTRTESEPTPRAY